MEKTIEQLAVLRFCWKAGFNTTKTFEMIQKVYNDSTNTNPIRNQECQILCYRISKRNTDIKGKVVYLEGAEEGFFFAIK